MGIDLGFDYLRVSFMCELVVVEMDFFIVLFYIWMIRVLILFVIIYFLYVIR